MVKLPDLTITSLETITAFDISDGYFLFALDELQDTTISQEEETTDITGKQGRKLSKLKRNKTCTVSGTNGLVSGGLFEMQTGSTFENDKTTEVMWIDYLTVSGNTAETSYIAVGTTGAEIVSLYIKNTDGTLSDLLTQGDTPSDGVFSYDPASKTLEFSGLDDGTEIMVYYKRNIVASVLANYSDKFSGKCQIYIDAIGEDRCANLYHVQFYIPKADFDGSFSFEMGDSQTVHSFDIEALAGACGLGNMFWTYTIFGYNAEDIGSESNPEPDPDPEPEPEPDPEPTPYGVDEEGCIVDVVTVG